MLLTTKTHPVSSFSGSSRKCVLGDAKLLRIGITQAAEGSFGVVPGNVHDGVSFGDVHEAVYDGWKAACAPIQGLQIDCNANFAANSIETNLSVNFAENSIVCSLVLSCSMHDLGVCTLEQVHTSVKNPRFLAHRRARRKFRQDHPDGRDRILGCADETHEAG